MKNSLMTMTLMFLAAAINAQTFGIKAGYTHSHIQVKNNSTLWNESHFVPGFNLAGTFEFPLSDKFSLVSGIGFTTKGAKGEKIEEINFFDPHLTHASYHYEINILNLEIPLQIKFAHDAGDYKFYAAVGSYCGLSIAARSHHRYEFKYQPVFTLFPGTSKNLTDGNWSNNEDIQRFDYGGLATLGIERNKFSFSTSFSYGIANLSDGGLSDDYRISYRSLEFSVGYWFGE